MPPGAATGGLATEAGAARSRPTWPTAADAKGIEVARVLTDAHAPVVGVDQAVAAVTEAAAAV